MDRPLQRKENLLMNFRKKRAFGVLKTFTPFSELNIKLDPKAMREFK